MTTKQQLIERLNELPESVQISNFSVEYTDRSGYPNRIEYKGEDGFKSLNHNNHELIH